jgi:hypothetical protein
MTWLKNAVCAAARLARRRHSARCGCPLCSQGERDFRAMIGMPVRHPESLTRELPEALAALAAELWPDDEWAGIITDAHRSEGQS